jgi:hypothetical protein
LGSSGKIVGKNVFLVKLRVLHVKLSLPFTSNVLRGKKNEIET